MDYVTYNTSGALTGGYCQDLQPEHDGAHIEVTPEQRLNWTDYHANGSRDAVELITVPVLPTDEQLRAQFKARRTAAVAAIVVTVDGMQFDGDETSQSRMARAITVMEPTGAESTRWVLADNTEVSVTPAQLLKALALAGAEQTRLWVEA